jgi:hypothetical protein
MSDHQERAPNALAHGPVKSSDIERVRRDIGKCSAHVAREDEASATDRVRRLMDRDGDRALGHERDDGDVQPPGTPAGQRAAEKS